MRRISSIFALVWASACCQGQNVITTVAGTDFVFTGDGKRAVDAQLGPVAGVAASPGGEIFITSASQNLVFKVLTDGTIKTVAGNGIQGFSGESVPPLNASLNFPIGVAVSLSGDVYIADQNNQRIRTVSGGVIFTLAGDPFQSDLGDQGPANAASLSYPGALALDSQGSLYFTDGGHDRIRVVTPDGNISTIAGNGVRGFSGDGGNALLASLNNPQGVAVDKSGNIYIADSGNHRIRRVSGDGTITTIAGAGGAGFSGDGGPAMSAMLNSPTGVAIDASGNIYIADFNNNRLRRIDPTGAIQTIAGGNQAGFSGDSSPARNALLNRPYSVAVDNRGNVFIADFDNYRVRKIAADGTMSTLAGNGSSRFSGDGGPAAFASLDGPQGVSIDAAGNLYIADTVNNRIRKVGPDGVISTIAGSGTSGFCGDGGNALDACVNLPIGSIASDGAGNLYFPDRDGNRVRSISPNGIISTVAGNGRPGFNGDGGPAVLAELSAPTDVDIDSAGNLYIADGGNNRVRMVVPDGTITTIAGNGQAGFSGDGGPATAASLQTPYGVTVDGAGNLYIADKDNKRVREVESGVITTVGGNGLPLFSGDGDALSNSIDAPLKVAVDGAGNLYVVDYFNQRIRRISPDGTMTTVAGNGRALFAGDGGQATSASLNAPTSVALDAAGNLYIADSGNNRIRAVLNSRPSFSVARDSISLSASAGGPPSQPETVQVSSTIAGLAFTVKATTADGGSWLRVSASQNTMPSILIISGDPSTLSAGQYSGTIQITAPDADPGIITISITFDVGVRAASGLAVAPTSFAFALNQSGSPDTQLLNVENLGIGPAPFLISASTISGGAWLRIGTQMSTTTPSQAAIVPITADPARLAPGAYNGRVTVVPAGGGARIDTPIILTVRPPRSSLKLTQTGLLFTAVAGGGIGPSQSFGIANTGSGVMNWTVTTKTLSGGNWLSISPASGSTTPGAVVPAVNVSAGAASLPAGDYFGQVIVTAPGADNSPKIVTVVLSVLRQGINPGAALDQVGVLFTGTAGASNPGSQDVRVFNVASTPVSFGASSGTADGLNWLTQIPATAKLIPNQPAKVIIQPNIAGLGPGIRYGTVTLTFDDGTYRVISVTLVLAPPKGNTGQTGASPVCSPTQLAVTVNQAPNQSNQFVPAGYPNQLSALVSDDCGQPLATGSVVATFSSGDPALSLFPRGNGMWETTWTPVRNTPVTITFTAQDRQSGIGGTAVARAAVAGTADAPQINPDGIVNAVSLSSQAPLTPGGLISILGIRLADGQASSPRQAWQTKLVNTSVLLAGQLLPLQSANDGQISAIVPFDVPVNTKQSLLLQRGNAIATVADLPMISAQPAIYTTNQAGSMQGQIFVVGSDGTQKLADGTNPATAGDTIVIRAAGLGAVDPAVAVGVAAPAAPLSSTVNPVSLSIAGKDAQVLSATLSPGEIGVYLVRAMVPSGIGATAGAPVIAAVAGQLSPAVTMALR